MSIAPIEHAFIDEPLPTRRKSAPAQDAVWALLSSLEVGKAVEINRGRRAAEQYVYRYRRKSGTESLFTTRASGRPGWSRIWRTR